MDNNMRIICSVCSEVFGMNTFSSIEERYCLTWRTNTKEHNVRNIKFGEYDLILELQPNICQSVIYIFLYDKKQTSHDFNVKTYVLNNEGKKESQQVYKGSLKNGPAIYCLKRNELLDNKNIAYESQYINFGCKITSTRELHLDQKLAYNRRRNRSELNECQINYADDCISNELYECKGDIIAEDEIQYDSEMEEVVNDQTLLEIMSIDFSSLYESKEGSDVTLECVDRQIKAHRYILSSRSDVFKAMFRSKMLESQNGVVIIKDMDPDILELVIKYIYSGRVENMTIDIASNLYKASDKYNIGSLKSYCVYFLQKNLSDISACDILLLANTYSDKKLEKSVTEFMVANSASLKTEQWEKLCEEHPSLGIKIYRKYVSKHNSGALRF